MDSRNRFRFLAILIVIFSACMNTSLAKQHPVRHAHSRHKRQHGPRTFSPDYYVIDGHGGPELGDWGHWSEPSECSRTCGGGIAFQTRHCRDIGPDGNIRCQGGSKRYFSCNIQDCPDGEDFRARQCAEFNRVPIDNKFYEWVPYTNAPNQCELNCMPKGERFFYRHKRKVADGTRCDSEKLDVCVDGQCLPVGCDRKLGSDAREDICRECRGDGSSCNTVEGVLDNNDLQVGYNDILLIPAGATNIKVKEVQPTNNYLAIRNTSGYYYLNGHWRIDFPRDLSFAGTIFHYERKPHKFFAPESLSALGPTVEAIYISLLYQEPNPGIMYEYSIPKGVSPHSIAENYTWIEGEFGGCSRTCGGGMQQRYVQCVRKSDMAPVSSDLCDAHYMPSTVQQCGEEPCPPEWSTGHWSSCSESCEKGIQERQVYCTQVIANGLPSVVDENECANAGPKPETKQECNVDTICPSWHVGPWKPCDRLCGDGKERRDVVCYRKVEGKIEVLDDRYCTGEKPESEKPCMIKPCDGVDWITSEWSGCDEKCGLTQETRTAQCATQSGVVFPNSFCHEYRLPELVRDCESPKKCEHEWYAGQWSKCSSKCGSGVQTRRVFCGMIDEDGSIKKVEDDKCDAAEKYESEQPCEGEEECKGDWFSGPWSKCSKVCGGGQKARKVLCLQNNESVPITNCDGNSIPFTSESCNDFSCGEDEVYTVEPTHDLSEDEKESEELEEDEECEEDEEEEPEEVTTSLDGLSTKEASDMTSPSDMSGMTEGVTEESMGTDTESSQSTESSSVGSTETSIGSTTDFSSSSSGSSTSGVGSSSESSTSSSDTSGSTGDSSATSSSSSSQSSEFTSSSFSTSDLSSSVSFSSTWSLSDTSSSDISSSLSTTSDLTSSDSSSKSSDTSVSEFSASTSPFSSESTTLDSSSSSSSDSTSEASISTESDASSSSTDSTKTSESSSSAGTTLASSSSSDSSTTDSSSSSEMTASSTSEITSSSSSDMTSSSYSDMTSSSSSDMTTSSSITSESTTDTSSTDSTFTASTDSSVSSESSSSSSSSSTDFSTSSSISSTSDSGISSSSSSSSSSISSGSTDTSISSSSGATSSTESSSSISSSSSSSRSSSSISSSSSSISSSSSSTDSSVSDSSSSSVSTSSSSEMSSSTESTEVSSTLRSIGEVESEAEESTSLSPSTSEGTSMTTEETTFTGSSTSSPSISSSVESSTSSSSISSSAESTSEGSTSPGSSVSPESTSETELSSTSSLESSSSSSSDTTVSQMSSSASGSPDETLSTSALWSTTHVTDLWGSPITSIQMAITRGKKLKKCKPKKKPACTRSEFGCCADGKTPAEGPFSKGCPQPETCGESTFGCCPDGVSPALGKNNKGCPPSNCAETLFGCCLDGISISQGNDYEGCPEDVLPVSCASSQFGCCPDNVTSATGPKFKGCFECEGSGDCDTCNDTKYGCCPDNLRAASGPDFEGCEEGSGVQEEAECAKSTYGCCPDGILAAEGPNFENCGVIDNCTQSYYGCCPDGITAAQGSRYEGCRMPCESEQYGCCDDNSTPAHGPNKEGCCLMSPFGCCPDNILYARGPNFEGCGCQYSPFGCCPDNSTAARGYANEGCGCQYTEYGCCPNNYTPAAGPGYQGCPCYTFQFGCCPDGVTTAKGPQRMGCGCENTEFGCCSDGKTPANGPEFAGCGCEASRFGCCPDGATESQGENFEGCVNVPLNPGEVCRKEKDRGSCRDFTVKWYYDMEYGGCSRFWYGGCEGNDNRFRSAEECRSTCVEPEGKARCSLPKVEGPCEGYYPRWYYDSTRKQCGQFIYSGCLGNNNNFETREECQEVCAAEQILDACDQEMDAGPCQGSYRRWYYNKDYKTCLEFRFGGCKPNGNNFLSQSACIEQCLQPGRMRVPIRDICQPEKDSGPCRGSILRWYYDKNLESCRQFLYGGCLGNTNRFKSEADCQSKCQIIHKTGDHCSLPRDPGNCTDRQPRWFFDYAENRCMPFYYTGCEGNGNRFETLEACEADCPPRVYQDLCMQPALVGECHNYTERWYYDAQAAYCKPFYYGGCGGNHNNFETRTACQRRCEPGHEPVVEDTPPPPPAPTQAPEAEPFRVEYCFYESDAGECRPQIYDPKWFYDRSDGVCKQFLYGGCGGNRNRFDSREECQHSCGKAQDICTLPKTVGPCSGSYRQWYYDRRNDSCYEFDYGGCLGNENRFYTRYDCEVQCKQGPVAPPTPPSPVTVPAPARPEPDPTDFCHAAVDPGPCLEERPAWYYDAQRQSCQAFVYGGCGGNPNRFDSEEQCERQCGKFKGQDVCNIPYDAGVCRGSLYKWYYDAEQRICKSFVYGGCEGNGNRFSSIEECETICLHREEVIPNANETFFSQAICRLPMEAGPCTDGHYKRWYFDESKSTCLPFIYSGCGGNFNRFKNFDTCVKFCRVQLRDLHPPPLYEAPDPNEIIPADLCENTRQECATLHCPYGIEKFVDSQDCERCRCNDPCSGQYCPEGTRCSVDLYSDLPNEIRFRSVCREERKPGQCPHLATGSGTCTRECQSDADCPGDTKCCESSCGSSCVEPVRPTQPPRAQETLRSYYPGAQPPSIIADEPVVTSEEGSYATLKCIVRGAPSPVVTWRKDNTLIDGSSGRHRFLPDGSLQIIGLYPNDAGVYYCTAENGIGQPAEKEFMLHVKDPVERPAEVVGEENSFVVVTLGSPTILQCYVIGWPRPKVIWWRGDQILPLSYGQFEQRRDFSLLVKAISLRDLGPYVCQAYNGLGKAVSGTITVQAIGPVYSNNPDDEPYFQYLVSAPQRPPEPQTTARAIHRVYPFTTPIHHPETTTRASPPRPQPESQPQPDAARVYRVPLVVNISLEKTSFPVDSDISIPCDVDGYPIPRVTWYKDGEVLQPSRRIEVTESNRLRIIRADGGDSGTYRCEAENQFERVGSTVEITVEGVYVHPNCTDNVFFANCELIVKARHCQHRYYARFCCRSCTQAGQLPSHGPHLDQSISRRVQE